MKRLLTSLLFISAFQCFNLAAFCQPQQSENFRITKSVLDAGGGTSSSTNFQLLSAFGQPTPVGIASSANFTLYAGFLSPTFAIAPTSPIQDVVIVRAPGPSSNMRLDWSAIPNATEYTIYRATTSTFVPGPGNQIGTSATNTFTDIGAANLPAVQHFYIVTYTFGNGPAALETPGTQAVSNRPAARPSDEAAKR